MQTFSLRLVTAIAILAPLALFLPGAHLSTSVSARVGRVHNFLAAEDAQRRARHTALRTRLSSTLKREFRNALIDLSALHEQGALGVWESALKNPDLELRKEAWAAYQEARPQLSRGEQVPQVVRVRAPADEVLDLARAMEFEVNIWSRNDGEPVVAAPPYLVERLNRAGIDVTTLYDSISDWQAARARGDSQARALEPEYLSRAGDSKKQVRIAIVDLVGRGRPAAGYSDWLGDRENILMRNGSLLAYLDVFAADGSIESINSHIERQYTNRGYPLSGFYTMDEFAQIAPRLFPGKTFDAGRRRNGKPGEITAALLEGRFHSYDETLAEFTALAQAHPDIASLVNLGPTYENRQIFALKITKDPTVNDSSKPEVLITGNHHAREWISVEPPVHFANQLINGYSTNDSMKYLVDNLQIWIVPIVNPDGLTYSQGQENDRTDGVRLWRKNRRPITIEDCPRSGVGVDLNRNYDFQWRLRGDDPCPRYSDDMGGSDDPENEIYRGPRAGSELEVKAIKSLVDDPGRHFRAELDYHNYTQLILYPWGYQSDGTPDGPTLAKLAERMSAEILAVNRQVYTPQQAIDLYTTTGASVDYSYGASRIPASFTVEVRPTCCSFNVPENQIAEINEENWAAARFLLEWAAGPPILKSVQAYQRAADGSTSKLVYSGGWQTGAEGGRHFTLDTKFPGLEPGRIILRLQFSKPMAVGSEPRATLGRTTPPDELRLAATDQTQGWQKTVYAGDTWVGEATIPQDGNQTGGWHLAVGLIDALGFKLDALPETIAAFAIGTNGWLQYEDSNSAGAEGGADSLHLLPPTLSGDSLDIFVASPNGGERLAAGEPYRVTWRVPRDSGFTPVQQELLLSIDGGVNYTAIAQGISGSLETLLVTLPRVATTTGRMRVVAREGTVGNFVFGDNKTNFTIAGNVGTGVEVGFASSERVDLNWSEAASEDLAAGASGTSRLIINLNVVNQSGVPIANPFIRVNELTGGNVLLTRDSKSRPAAGARQSVDVGADDQLDPGDSIQVRMIVGLVNRKKMTVKVEFYGVPVGGSIIPASAVRVWKGKPKTK
jgi:hypothetical protein